MHILVKGKWDSCSWTWAHRLVSEQRGDEDKDVPGAAHVEAVLAQPGQGCPPLPFCLSQVSYGVLTLGLPYALSSSRDTAGL